MKLAVIDTETTWGDEVMSIGAVVADAENYRPIDSRYYIISPTFRDGGMYSGVLHLAGAPRAITGSREQVMRDLAAWLSVCGVSVLFAYNALFDKQHLPELNGFEWRDIMRIAAYRQYNMKIPDYADCCTTGRLKRNYGVQAMYRLLSGDEQYLEKHNGWFDAIDELRIIEMLEQPLETYELASI